MTDVNKHIPNHLRDFILLELLQDPAIEIDFDDDLLGGAVINSLGLLKLINFVESEYNVSIDEEDILPENFQSIISIVALIDRKTSSSSPRC